MSESKTAPSSVRALIAKLPRYERDVIEERGGHYGEEIATRVDIVPCETGAWVKFSELEAALSPLLEEPEQHFCVFCHHRWTGPEVGRSEHCGDCHRKFIAWAASVERTEERQEGLKHWRTCEDCGGLLVYDKADVDAALSSLGAPPTPACDCITSGNIKKPKQHGADPHAKNCAIYRV